MKLVCKYLGYCVIVLGILGSIFLAKNFGVTIEESYRGIELTRSWPLTIIYFIAGLLSVSICASILLGISEILEYLESVKEVRTEGPIQEEDPISRLESEQLAESTFWKCSECGKSNPPYTGTCSCGQARP